MFLYSCKPAIIYINTSRAQIKRTKNAFALVLSISHIHSELLEDGTGIFEVIYSELLEDGTGIFEVIREELSILKLHMEYLGLLSPQTMTRKYCFPACFAFEQADKFGFEHKLPDH